MATNKLMEAAADILAGSKKSASGEPMYKTDAEVVDLGGPTKQKSKPMDDSAKIDAAKAIKGKAAAPTTKPSDASSKMEDTEGQIQSEIIEFNALLHKIYADFGIQQIFVKLSTRPIKRVGSDAVWDKAELALENALRQAGLSWTVALGEGAFYGPKIEYSLKDSLGRIWQCGTIQVDFSMPERLGAEYVAEDGSKQTPVMLHRVILGSLERFIGVLIEDTAGSFPVWLAPIQVAILNISEKQTAYAQEIAEHLRRHEFLVDLDLRNEKIGFKIREHTIQRVPYLLVLGDREVEQSVVTVRTREGVDLGAMSIAAFIERLSADIQRLGGL
jgi:threonyl-tRNA synthetase